MTEPLTVECTGLAASWCPFHGDCTCPEPEDEKSDWDCPLHGELSEHPRTSWTADPLDVLRAAHAGGTHGG